MITNQQQSSITEKNCETMSQHFEDTETNTSESDTEQVQKHLSSKNSLMYEGVIVQANDMRDLDEKDQASKSSFLLREPEQPL